MKETIQVTWKLASGSQVSADVRVGDSLMHAAVHNGVEGVIGDCGGALACATCHVYVEHTPADLPGVEPVEQEMLAFAEVQPEANSRLSCQIMANEFLDGLVLRVPGL